MTRRRMWSLIGLGVLVYLLALLATFPAARALALTDGPLRAAGVEGSIWAGSATRAQIGAQQPLTDLHWDTVAWRLLTGRLVADARFEIAGVRVDGRFSRNPDGALVAHDTNVQGPARSLAQLARAGALALGGGVVARITKARIEDGQARTLRGRFQWSDAVLLRPVRIGLGTVTGHIRPTDEGVHTLKLDARGGEVEGAGEIRLFANGRYEIELTLNPTRDAPAHIAGTLSLLARPDGNGGFVLRQSGRL